MKNNKKGFTLVELLAVIVILAVVMLIAVTAVGPLMDKARKGAFGTEIIGAIDAAKMAYQASALDGEDFSKYSNICLTIEYLKSKQYYEKGAAEEYYGSVLIAGGTTYSALATTKKYSISALQSANDINKNVINTPNDAFDASGKVVSKYERCGLKEDTNGTEYYVCDESATCSVKKLK